MKEVEGEILPREVERMEIVQLLLQLLKIILILIPNPKNLNQVLCIRSLSCKLTQACRLAHPLFNVQIDADIITKVLTQAMCKRTQACKLTHAPKLTQA